ncbi:MAG: OmpA family protein [Alphaproteobacteria bacterium]|nr:OmpA family protein [Alphaproteobacteria bacterium]
MTNIKTLALGTVAVIGLGIAPVSAEEGFTPHVKIAVSPYKDYAEQLPVDQKLALHEYLNYESREPCQFYQPVPEGFVRDGCHIRRDTPQPQKTARVETKKSQSVQQTKARKVLADYEINFAFDSANIEPAAGDTLDQVANEIKTHSPSEVTVAGHADRAGSSDYNVTLSQKRAHAVSDALADRGVANRVIDEEAYGESNPAVPTQDGVVLRENRRTVIEFLK